MSESADAAEDFEDSGINGRPIFHFVAPCGWMNDPCAPVYDARRQVYHLSYQWNPNSPFWGDISWGSASSPDLVHWAHTSLEPILSPDQPYDNKGVFTGCMVPTGPHGGPDDLSIFYTNVCNLPVDWKIPYSRGSEGISLAVSTDGGLHWTKHANNPILPEEPPDVHVTGFRDPFVAAWPSLRIARRDDAVCLYALVSGGVHNVGPCIWLYTIRPDDLTSWTYCGPILSIPRNHIRSIKWGGDVGANFECANFLTLHSPSDTTQTREVILVGSEGGMPRQHTVAYHAAKPLASQRVVRYMHWMFVDFRKDSPSSSSNGDPPSAAKLSVTLYAASAGLLDWGLYYACSTCKAADGRNVAWGWLIEEDLPASLLEQKGWTGCLGVPREIYLQRHDNVDSGWTTPIHDIDSVSMSENKGTGLSNLFTLGIRPICEMDALRRSCVFTLKDVKLEFDGTVHRCLNKASASCEIDARLSLGTECEAVTLFIRHNQPMTVYTSIIFSPVEETLIVRRGLSTTNPNVNTCDEVASHTLFRYSTSKGSESSVEVLHLRVFIDRDVVEVFANERCAISTRVYTPSEYTGISLSAVGGAVVETIRIWTVGSIGLE